MIKLHDVEQSVKGHSLVKGVDTVPRGHIRIETGLIYPDGTSIEVFLVEELELQQKYKLSDLGQTTSWLLSVQVKPWLSKRRQRLLEDAIHVYGVEQAGGVLETRPVSLENLPEAIIRMGQACLRVSDLSFTRRSSLETAFGEEVEEVLADSELRYDTNVELAGRYNKPVRVDFLVYGARARSAVLTLASGNPSQAHIVANETFRRWYDLNVPERPEQRVTIFDDQKDVYREEDLSRLRDLSTVVGLSDHITVCDVLAA